MTVISAVAPLPRIAAVTPDLPTETVTIDRSSLPRGPMPGEQRQLTPAPRPINLKAFLQFSQAAAASAPAVDPYAYVYKDGRQVGFLGNDGSATLNAAVNLDWRGGPPQGPALAQYRADQLTKAGFSVAKADTAVAPGDWKPWAPPQLTLDAATRAYVDSAALARRAEAALPLG